jgi:Ca2+-binding RTX toxin-like protein
MTGAGAFSITSEDATVTITEIDGVNVTGNITLDFDNTYASALSVETGSGDDTILGSLAADTINGGSGDDSITGGLSADDITLGAGSDEVVLTSALATDTIQDFNVDDDQVDLSVAGLAMVDGNSDAVAAADAVVVQELADADADAIALLTNVIVFTDAQDNAADMLGQLDDLSFAAGSAIADNDDVIVVWTDGNDTYISSVNVLVTGVAIDDDAATNSTLAVLVGVDINDVVAATFDFVA